MRIKPDSRFVLHIRHLPTALGAFSTGFDAFIHSAELLAILRAGLADFGADLAQAMLKLGATELKIGRRLADLGAIHQEPEVWCFNVLSAGLKAMVHGGLQADLMATAACLDTGLQAMFSVCWLIHGLLLS
jgi:hypothetical protein